MADAQAPRPFIGALPIARNVSPRKRAAGVPQSNEMQHDLAQRVESIRVAASRLTWAYGLCRFGAAAIVTLVAFCFVDWLLRAHDPVLRWLFTAAAVAFLAAEFTKLAWPAIRFRPGILTTARRIERQFPELGERLTSAIAFLAEPETDATAGSAELRRAVIAQAESVASDVDFRSALDRRPIVRVAALLAIAAAVPLCFLAVSPATVTLAASRLALPWRDLAWPRQHELAFVDPPARLAKGDDLELTLIDRRGSLPDDAQILIRRTSPSGARTETRPMKPLGDRVVLRLDNVTEALEYR